MEPISYLMMFSNFTFGYFFYLAMKRELVLTNFYEILIQRFLESSCRRNGIDYKQHKLSETEIDEMRNQIAVFQNWDWRFI